jgi:hypothetical protein
MINNYWAKENLKIFRMIEIILKIMKILRILRRKILRKKI